MKHQHSARRTVGTPDPYDELLSIWLRAGIDLLITITGLACIIWLATRH